MWNATPWERTAKLLGEHRENQFLPKPYLSSQFNAYAIQAGNATVWSKPWIAYFSQCYCCVRGNSKNMHDDFLSWGFCIPKISKQPKIATWVHPYITPCYFFRMANFLLKYLCQNKYVYPRTLQLSDINQTLVLIGRVSSKAMVNLWWAYPSGQRLLWLLYNGRAVGK